MALSKRAQKYLERNAYNSHKSNRYGEPAKCELEEWERKVEIYAQIEENLDVGYYLDRPRPKYKRRLS